MNLRMSFFRPRRPAGRRIVAVATVMAVLSTLGASPTAAAAGPKPTTPDVAKQHVNRASTKPMKQNYPGGLAVQQTSAAAPVAVDAAWAGLVGQPLGSG